MKLEFRIPFVSGFPDCLTCFQHSKAKDFGFDKQKDSGIRYRNPDSLTWGALAVSSFSNSLLDYE